MGDVLDSYRQILDGAWLTIQITLYGSALALVMAVVFGLVGTSRHRAMRVFNRVYVEVFRGTAALVLMFWFFYAAPQLGFELVPKFAAVLALGLNVGAYGAEVVRGAINAVPKTQYEATIALNFGTFQRMRRVIFPQALSLMLPPLGNLLIELLKGTAVVSLITLSDLLRAAKDIQSNTGETLWTFGTVLVLYFVIAQALQVGVRLLERRVDRMLGRRVVHEPTFGEVAASAPGSGVKGT